MEEDHKSEEQTTPRQKNAKRKQRDSTEDSSAAKRTRRDDSGAFFARQKRYDKKIAIKAKKYERAGPAVSFKSIKDKKVKGKLIESHKQSKEAAERLARAEILQTNTPGFISTEGELERTYKVRQSDIADAVDVKSAKKIFDLKLDKFGPYTMDFSRTGKHIILGGAKGHLAMFNWERNKLNCEIFVKENIHDVHFLHNETMFAVAQKKYVYIYDKQGTELHRLKQHEQPLKLDFLPYHFLLTSIGDHGILRYHDTSTGNLVVEHKTKLGLCRVMKQNPKNAIIHLGHQTGVVTLWSPSMSKPHVKMLCHRGPINDLVIDATGTYMTTAGVDGRVSIWDLRMLKSLQTYYTKKPVEVLSISQRGLLSMGFGNHIQVWKDYVHQEQKEPYMSHNIPFGGRIRHLSFVPFDDVLGIGHDAGYSSILIPGAGEANYDTFEANPFETKKQRREATVTRLLEKLQPEMITLDVQQFATVTKTEKERHQEDLKLSLQANAPGAEWAAAKQEKRKKRGAKKRKTQQNVVDKRREEKQAENRKKLLAAQEAKERGEDSGSDDSDDGANANSTGAALSRFKK